MRKIILDEFVTIDGFAAGLNGELDFFGSTAEDEEVNQDSLRFIETIDTMLLGAVTYRLFAD